MNAIKISLVITISFAIIIFSTNTAYGLQSLKYGSSTTLAYSLVSPKNEPIWEPDWYAGNGLVAHAGGGIEGEQFTNSLDALEFNYSKGIRVFEVDLIFSSDCKLICRHDWGLGAYLRFKQAYNSFDPIMSLNVFKNTKISGKFMPMTASDLINFLNKHQDIYLITDFKNENSFVYRSSVRELLDEIKKVDPRLIDRIIWQIYSKENLADLKSVYKVNPDHIIFCLYMKPMKYASYDIFNWMIQNKINVLGLSESFYNSNKTLVKQLLNYGIKTYVFTINDKTIHRELKKNYVFGVYTDMLY